MDAVNGPRSLVKREDEPPSSSPSSALFQHPGGTREPSPMPGDDAKHGRRGRNETKTPTRAGWAARRG